MCNILDDEKRMHTQLKETWQMANDQFLESQRLMMMDMRRMESLLSAEQQRLLAGNHTLPLTCTIRELSIFCYFNICKSLRPFDFCKSYLPCDFCKRSLPFVFFKRVCSLFIFIRVCSLVIFVRVSFLVIIIRVHFPCVFYKFALL